MFIVLADGLCLGKLTTNSKIDGYTEGALGVDSQQLEVIVHSCACNKVLAVLVVTSSPNSSPEVLFCN